MFLVRAQEARQPLWRLLLLASYFNGLGHHERQVRSLFKAQNGSTYS